MAVEYNILNQISEKFPGQAQEIAKKYSENERFREVCEDYVLCLSSIRKIKSINTRDKVYLEEYKSALTELKCELLSYLNTNKNEP